MAEGWLVALAAAIVLAIVGTIVLRRPRLVVELSLRGGTREGVLYATIHNRGHTAARRVRARIVWAAGADEAMIAERELGALAAHDAVRIEARDLQRAWRERRDGWTHLRASVSARNAFPARAEVALQARGPREEDAPVRYAPASVCPDAPDGRHRMEQQSFPNDGVVERWEVCRACRYVRRLPLTPEEEAIQARVRAERAAREARRLEEEWARAEREEGGRARERRAPPPPEEPGDLPLAVAYWVLELDARSATWQDVLDAHRRLAMSHHPDRAPGLDARARSVLEARMQEINRARDRLREHLAPDARRP